MQDFIYYQDALERFYAGQSPYAVRGIGPGYLYPPAALFIIEAFSPLKSVNLLAVVFIVVNVVLMTAMAHGIAKHYRLGWRQTWHWYPLCLGFAPFLELLHIGQINVITMFGIFLLFTRARRSDFVAGLGLCLAVLTKVSPLLLFAWVVFCRLFKAGAVATVAIVLVSALAAARYGTEYTLEYVEVMQWLATIFMPGTNPMQLTAKLQWLNFQYPGIAWLEFAARQPAVVQRILTLHILAMILTSGVLTWVLAKRGRAGGDEMFAIVALGMAISPNIMWYHHFVFVLLPLLVWMARSKLNPLVVGWCLLGLFVMQYDRWHPPYGLLFHAHCHASLLLILATQIRRVMRTAPGR